MNFEKFEEHPFYRTPAVATTEREAFTETSYRRVLKSRCLEKFHKISCSYVAESFFSKMTR